MDPNEPHRPCISRDRANHLGETVAEIAEELLKLRYTVEDEEQNNPLVLELCNAIEAHGTALLALAQCWPLAWKVER